MNFLALANGSVITGMDPIRAIQATLLMRGARIHGLYGSQTEAEASAGGAVETVDVFGMTVLPGLVDSHVHLFFRGGSDMVNNYTQDLQVAYANAQAHLQAGVTTVRDLGAALLDILRLRDGIATGERRGPRVVAAGPILTVPGGHGEFVGMAVRSRVELVDAIHRLADEGADCVKVAVSGGVSTPGSDPSTQQFSQDELTAAVRAAHHRGLAVAAHASNPESVVISARSGVDSVEHAINVDENAVRALQQAGATVVPTLAATSLPPEFFDDELIPRYIRDKGRSIPAAHRACITRVIESGIPVIGGTDAGTTATAHGLIATEAAEMVACGLSHAEAIAAITRDAAATIGLAGQVGQLREGMLADAMVLEGNPLEDIACLSQVRLVVKEGAIVVRQGSGDSTGRGTTTLA